MQKTRVSRQHFSDPEICSRMFFTHVKICLIFTPYPKKKVHGIGNTKNSSIYRLNARRGGIFSDLLINGRLLGELIDLVKKGLI